MGATAWGPDDIIKLKELWARNLSAAQIMGHFQFRFTRSAICGKIMRLGLPERAIGLNHGSRQPIPRKPRLTLVPKPSEPVDPILAPPEPIGIPGEFPDKGCQWIAGEFTPDFIMCGAPIHKGRFCTFHSHLGHDKKPMPMRGTSRSDRAFS